MNQRIKDRAESIRDYVSKFHAPDPGDLYKFSIALATWDRLRWQIDRGPATVGDDQRLAELTVLCEDLSERCGLGRTLTTPGGFLHGCASERILARAWQEASGVWWE